MTTKAAAAELPQEEAWISWKPVVEGGLVFATVLLMDRSLHAEKSLQALYVSVAHFALCVLWVPYLQHALPLHAADYHGIGFRTLLRMTASATSALAVAGLADAAAITVAAFRTVAAMLATLLVSVALSATLFDVDLWARYLQLLFHAANRRRRFGFGTPTMTTKAEAEHPQEKKRRPRAGCSPDAQEATSSEPALEGGMVFATVLPFYVLYARADHGDEPAAALLVLHLSVTLSALLDLWSRYLTLPLQIAANRVLGFRTLLRFTAWGATAIAVAGLADAAAIAVEAFRTTVAMLVSILVMFALMVPFDLWVRYPVPVDRRTLLRLTGWAASAVAVAGVADAAVVTVAAFRTVAAMLVMVLVTLCFAARFGWCCWEHLRNSPDTTWASTSTSLEQEKLATATARDGSHDAFLHKKSPEKAKLAQAQENNDLAASLLVPEA